MSFYVLTAYSNAGLNVLDICDVSIFILYSSSFATRVILLLLLKNLCYFYISYSSILSRGPCSYLIKSVIQVGIGIIYTCCSR